MPIESVPANDRRERFLPTAGQTLFPFDFPIYTANDLAVRRLRAGTETVLALGTDYTLTGAGEQAGGTVTLTAGSLAGDVLTLISAQAAGRQAQFVNGGALPAASLEAEFNRLEIAMQQLRDQLSRAMRLAETDGSNVTLPVASARAGRVLSFDAAGSPIAVSVAVGGALVTPYAETLLDDLNAAAARATLGATATGGALMTAADAAAARATLGATVTGGALMTAADAAAARATLGVTVTPQAAAGLGQFVNISVGANTNVVLPAGGVWLYSVAWFASGSFNSHVTSIAAGGTTIFTGSPTNTFGGWCWRIG